MKVTIPAAGLGTRLLSATKEQPKEMLPVFAADKDGIPYVTPLVQLIFEQLFDLGMREFYFVVGKGKRAIEDHFTRDDDFLRRLTSRGKSSQALLLERFYRKIEASAIVWINQSEPKGFGDAVLTLQFLMSTAPFMVHAGDTCVISNGPSILERLTKQHAKGSSDVSMVLQEVTDPRQYGVAEVAQTKEEVLEVKRVVEKPEHPTSRLAIMPLYVFNPNIFEALRVTRPGQDDEIQLTDAIQKLIDTGHRVQAIKLLATDICFDVGTPETYWTALEVSHTYALSRK